MSNSPRFAKPVTHTGEVSPFVQRLSRLILRLWGWRIDRWQIPDDLKKIVIVGEHHTSNVDGFLLVLIVPAMGRRLSWLVKSELNLPIIGAMIRATGGVFVDRHQSKGTVSQVAERFQSEERLFLVLAPSSTRSKTDRWRKGFYYMALEADVPIGMGYLDYANKCAGVASLIKPSGDLASDAVHFREFYSQITALHPEKASDVAFDIPDDQTRKAS